MTSGCEVIPRLVKERKMRVRGCRDLAVKTRLFLMILLACGLTGSHASAQGEKAAALVNGEIITEGEFFDRLQRIRGQAFLAPNSQLRPETAGQIVLEALLFEKLTLQAAGKANLLLTDAEVATELETVKKQPQVINGLATHAFTEDQIKYDLRVQGARFNLTSAGAKVTPEDVEKYYQAHIADYTIPERWGLSLIRTGSIETLAKIDTDLKAGKSFAETAKLYSDDVATKANGGDIGIIFSTDTRVPAVLRDAVRPLKLGQITQPIKIEQDAGPGKPKVASWWRLLLKSKEPASVRPLNEIKTGIERLALIEKAGGYQVGDKKVADFRLTSVIKINLPGYESLASKK